MSRSVQVEFGYVCRVNDAQTRGADARLHRLVEAITRHTRLDHPAGRIELAETHISLILMTGPFAYKFKKSVKLRFLDFSSLALRKRYCEEECRLNRRTTPELYAGVAVFTGDEHRPVLNGTGPVLEYAVKMVRFPARSEWRHALADGRLEACHVDSLATRLAEFHRDAPRVSAGYPGSAACIRQQALDNFSPFREPAQPAGIDPAELNRLADWTAAAAGELHGVFASRQREGYVRDCHGDLHVGNILLIDGAPRLFDCIEFSENLRVIDVMSEVSFLFMDLDAAGRADFAWRLLNDWLQHTGDYSGLAVFRFYLAYRAMVRAGVSCIRLGQPGLDTAQRAAAREDINRYLGEAGKWTRPGGGRLLITHGLSGSGKSWLARRLAERLGAVQVRSDVERKRLQGLPATHRATESAGEGLYRTEITAETYQRLAAAAEAILEAGFTAIIDAAFLKRAQRAELLEVARERRLPFLILDCAADPSILKSRLGQRLAAGIDASDADAAVLDWQLRTREELTADELAYALPIDTGQTVDTDAIVRKIQSLTIPGTNCK